MVIQEMLKLTAELQVLRQHQPDMVTSHLHVFGTCLIALVSLHSLQSLDELRRRLAIIDNELTKEKSVSRLYQVATERLMQFVEVGGNDNGTHVHVYACH